MSSLEILSTGPLALLQDGGRPGLAALGVSRSGAADRAAYELATRLAGNDPGAAAVEITFGGLAVRAAGDLLFALTGADSRAVAADQPVAPNSVGYLRDGEILRLGVPAAGLRTYLAVRGGFAVDRVLGSASTDVLSGIGPARLAAGDRLHIRSTVQAFASVDGAPVPPPVGGPLRLEAIRGPRDAWCDLEGLTGGTWTIAPQSNRVGIRLEGEPMIRRPAFQGRELPSEPVVRGSVQVPHDGRPVVFGPDHPVTGGYPVVAVLTAESCDRLAQGRPGQAVRFRLR